MARARMPLLIKEGEKTYAAGSRFKTVEAFSDVALSKEEIAVLNRVAAAFQKEAASLGRELGSSKARQEFEDCKARATDSNPYMEYLWPRLTWRETAPRKMNGWAWNG